MMLIRCPHCHRGVAEKEDTGRVYVRCRCKTRVFVGQAELPFTSGPGWPSTSGPGWPSDEVHVDGSRTPPD